jgi:hypothetical protein
MCIFKVNMLSIIARFSVDRSILIDANEEFLKKGSKPALLIESKGHTLHAFVNQKYQGYPLVDSNFFALYLSVYQLSPCNQIRVVDHYELKHMPPDPIFFWPLYYLSLAN